MYLLLRVGTKRWFELRARMIRLTVITIVLLLVEQGQKRHYPKASEHMQKHYYIASIADI